MKDAELAVAVVFEDDGVIQFFPIESRKDVVDARGMLSFWSKGVEHFFSPNIVHSFHIGPYGVLHKQMMEMAEMHAAAARPAPPRSRVTPLAEKSA